jgi:hypothetical protein
MNEVTFATLQDKFPTVYPKFLDLIIEELQLFEAKNHDYASGGKVTGNFDRVANNLAQYPHFPYNDPRGVAVIYMLKQFDSIMWGLSQGIQHKVEGISGRAADLSVYAKILQIIESDFDPRN